MIKLRTNLWNVFHVIHFYKSFRLVHICKTSFFTCGFCKEGANKYRVWWISTKTCLRSDQMASKHIERWLVFSCRVKNHYFISHLQCYNIISNQKATWEDAMTQCISMKGNLVSIPSRRVQGLFFCFFQISFILIIIVHNRVYNVNRECESSILTLEKTPKISLEFFFFHIDLNLI